MQLAEKMSRIGTESAFEVLARARALEKQGKNIIHLEIGEPDFPTPAHVLEAGKRALDEGWTKYGPPGIPGIPGEHCNLRLAYSGHQSRRGQCVRGSRRQADHVFQHGGSPSPAMKSSIGSGFQFTNRLFVSWRQAGPVPLIEERGFSFDLNALRDGLLTKTKMVILNSPANPTGGVISTEDLAKIAEMLRDRDLIILSDEIYSRIYYENEPVSITSFDGMLEKTIILDGFSNIP
jgi:aspartate/methionine/tyrosine aminotransferase